MTANIQRYLLLAATFLLLTIATGSALGDARSVHADGEDEQESPILVPSDWGLRPSGVPVGGEFRLMVITKSTRNAQSADISDYDTFVQTEMKSTFAHQDIREYGDKFRVVGSTSAVSARDHIQAGPATRPGVPIYWLNGEKVARTYDKFFSGRWQSYHPRTANGRIILNYLLGDLYVRTGSFNNGTSANERVLGTTHLYETNLLAATVGSMSHGNVLHNTTVTSGTWVDRPFYAISPVFRVMDEGTPHVVAVEITSDAGDDGSYEAGDTISVKATFDQSVQVSGSPQLQMRFGMDDDTVKPKGSTLVNAVYASEHSTDTELTFTHTVRESDVDNDGVSVAPGSLRLNGGGIAGVASPNVNANLYNPLLTDSMDHRVNHYPRVERLLVTSNPRASSDEYGLGETIEFAVRMTEPVRVDTSGGRPKLGIQIGTSSVEASYHRTDGSSVIFGYAVLAGQLDIDGIRIKTNRLSLGGAAIRSVATGRNARVTFRSVDFTDHKVDAGISPPASDDAALSGFGLTGVSIRQDFDPDVTTYVGTVPNSVSETTLLAVTRDAGANVTYSVTDSNSVDPGTQASLAVGKNTVTVTVRATDNVTTKLYTIDVVRRMSGDLSDVSIASDAASVTEGTAAAFTLTRTAPHEGTLTVAVEVSQTGDVIATDNNYQAPTEVVFADGAGTATLTVSTHTDTTDEPDSTISVVLTPQATHTSDTTYSAQVTIVDDDETPAATLVLTSASVAENGGATDVTATLNRPSGEDTVLTVSATPDAPAVESDFTLSPNTELTIPAGATASIGTVTITAVDNSMGAADKALTISATATNAHGVVSPDPVTLTIPDDDSGVAAPMNVAATPGDSQVVLSWDAPASDADITRHEYRYRAEDGSYPTTWTGISNSAPGEDNEDSVTVTGLTNGETYWFQVNSVNDEGSSEPSMAVSAFSGAGLGICDRTRQVREEILDMISGVTDCADVTDDNLASITGQLRLAHTGIHELKPGDFGGLTKLTELRLYSDPITELPDEIFSDLSSLTMLDLRHNQIEYISAAQFTGLAQLADLDLRYNNLTTLPDSVFAGLPKLSRLNLSKNDLTAISASMFAGLPGSTDPPVLANLPELRVLNLSHNDLTTFPAGVFSKLTGLTELNLASNELQTLPANGFSGLSSLETLYLNNNRIMDLYPHMFEGLVSIKKLELSHNKMSWLTVHEPFAALSTLEILLMNMCHFYNTFGLSMFDGLTSLKSFQSIPATDYYLNVGDPVYFLYVGIELAYDREGVFHLWSQNGAPFNVEVEFEIENGSLEGGGSPGMMPVGTDVSQEYRVIRTPGTTGPVVVHLPQDNLPAEWLYHSYGYFVSGITLPEGDPEADIPPHLGYIFVPSHGMGSLEVIPALPSPTLSLSRTTILEQDDAGTADVVESATTVTATLAEPVVTALTIDVSVTAIGSASNADLTLSENTTLSFAANTTASTGLVTISAVDNDTASPDRQYTVSGTASATVVHAPRSVKLTMFDEDPPPAPTGLSAKAGDGEIALKWDAPASSDGIAGYEYRYKVNTDTDYPDTWTEVQGRYPGFSDSPPPEVPLHPSALNPNEEEGVPDSYKIDGMTNGEKYYFQVRAVNRVGTGGAAATSAKVEPTAPPQVELVLTPAKISEDESASTVTATLSYEVTAPFTVTVTASDSRRYVLSLNRTLSFAADSNTSAGVVTISPLDNTMGDGDVTITVSGEVSRAGVQAKVKNPSDVTLTITDDEGIPPTSEDTTVSTDEDIAYNFQESDFPFSDGDPDDSLVSVGILKLPLPGTFKFDGNALSDSSLTDDYKVDADDIDKLTFEPAPNGYGNNYASFTFTVNDGKVSSTLPSTMTINVTEVNDPPAFEGEATLSAVEGQTNAGHVLARDVDRGDSVAYSITDGADSGSFAVDSSTGQLTFTTTPDFDSPTDQASSDPENAAANNEYVVVVTATSGSESRVLTTARTLIVSVTEMMETDAGDREISAVSITSAPGDDEYYGIDDVVTVQVTFNGAVSVLPKPRLDIGLSPSASGNDAIPTVGSACYVSGSGSASLLFRYAVREGQRGYLVAQTLVADDGTETGTGAIYSGSRSNTAGLEFTPTSPGSGQAVDGVRPVLRSSSLGTDRSQIILVFREDISATTAAASAFAVTVNEEEAVVSSATASGREVTVTLASAVGAGERVELSYSEPTAVDRQSPTDSVCGLDFAADSANAIQDVAGNDARSFETVVDPGASPLTATFVDMPAEHTGSHFSFRISFSEAIGTSYVYVRDTAMSVTGGSVEAVHRIQGRSDLWNVTITPNGSDDVTVTLLVPDSCSPVNSNVCTSDKRGLSAAITGTVSGPPETPTPLTAEFRRIPREHDGATTFPVRIFFSSEISVSYLTLQNTAVKASGGNITAARRFDGRNDLWEIDVTPHLYKDVTVRLAADEGCGGTNAVCTSDSRALTNAPSFTVKSRPEPWLTVGDARASEGETLTFQVALSHAAPIAVTVDYATSDGSAKAGQDYTAVGGMLTFAAGELNKTLDVALLNDTNDESEESFLLRLSNSGGASIRDSEGTGRIDDAN